MLEMTLGPCGDRCYCSISHLYGSSRISWSLRIVPRWDPVAINDKTQVFLCFRSFRRGGLLFWGPYCLCCGIKSLHDPTTFERCLWTLPPSIGWQPQAAALCALNDWNPKQLGHEICFFFFQSEECTVALRLSSATHPLRCDATHVDTAKFTAVSILTRQLPL